MIRCVTSPNVQKRLKPSGSCEALDKAGNVGLLTTHDLDKLRSVLNAGLPLVAQQMRIVDPRELPAAPHARCVK